MFLSDKQIKDYSPYRRLNHFKEWLNQFQAKQSPEIPEQVFIDIVKELNNHDIQADTFRPKGPKDRYEWLSTTHINDVIEQYHNVKKNFLFLIFYILLYF